ncbi:STAS-like domain-containing protein [Patescibacteria group bacterium]|nr:STAS-like domain-containing protein [Patescibacteria group bacterium]
MTIKLKKFGTNLISRPAGKEALLAFSSELKKIKEKEEVIIDFEGVMVLTPSWADEFITPLQERFLKKVTLIHTENPSVEATLETLKEARRAKEAMKHSE